MLLYNQEMKKTKNKGEQKMKNLMKEEQKTINNLKRGLINYTEAQNYLFGYIKCMVDMQVIEKDRASEEKNRIVKRLLERK